MTPEEVSKFASQQHMMGKSDVRIAGALGMSPECMYRIMNRNAEKDTDVNDKNKQNK